MTADRLGAVPATATGRHALVVVPVGSLEQHGPHLPLDTDTRIAVAVARQVPNAWLAPAIAYGNSGEHEDFPGTVSIGAAALEMVLVEYGRSVCRWADRVLFVNGHGGNIPAVRAATELLRYEARDVAWSPCAHAGADPHAGRTETSILLHLDADVVGDYRAVEPVSTPLAQLLPRLRTEGVRAVSPSGVLGDPAAATADEGRMILDAMRDDLIARVDRWLPDTSGRLG
ncbi:mycofactocin biosynthesis peptidyl-dipeptidase MftE [Millisia brevis]|uniref:mycofactocin biosynthesis peptidyl-dipeptidase MftE n=1 Tax=Millisia brevis TaxID=264148 RepID=UPI0009FDB09E|nr:mycofactocin biosynthesis peptidyl-dipeptidase MftE [Millisia brevis]